MYQKATGQAIGIVRAVALTAWFKRSAPGARARAL